MSYSYNIFGYPFIEVCLYDHLHLCISYLLLQHGATAETVACQMGHHAMLKMLQHFARGICLSRLCNFYIGVFVFSNHIFYSLKKIDIFLIVTLFTVKAVQSPRENPRSISAQKSIFSSEAPSLPSVHTVFIVVSAYLFALFFRIFRS